MLPRESISTEKITNAYVVVNLSLGVLALIFVLPNPDGAVIPDKVPFVFDGHPQAAFVLLIFYSTINYWHVICIAR